MTSSTRPPFSHVPLPELRSSTARPPSGARWMRAWRRETSGSSVSRPSPATARPISRSPSSSIRRPAPAPETISSCSPIGSGAAGSMSAEGWVGDGSFPSGSVTRMIVWPIFTLSPGTSARTPSTRSPLTQVPLADPRSSICSSPSGPRRTRACCREASGSSPSCPSPSTVRPSSSSAPGSSRRPADLPAITLSWSLSGRVGVGGSGRGEMRVESSRGATLGSRAGAATASVTRIVVWPIRSSSPGRSGRRSSMRSPLTNVPFAEPRSSTTSPPSSARRTRAWRRDVSGSPPSRPSPSTVRPSSSSPSSAIRRPTSSPATTSSSCGAYAPRCSRVIRGSGTIAAGIDAVSSNACSKGSVTTSIVAPMRTRSPGRSGCGLWIRRPLTQVPLADPRSSTHSSPPPPRRMRACRAETSGSSCRRPSPSTPRPRSSSPSTRSRRPSDTSSCGAIACETGALNVGVYRGRIISREPGRSKDRAPNPVLSGRPGGG